ncbi:MAG: RagB/SusD family nutrient uptake outer membrane protein [Flavobacteriaceae bacterium]|nr:MAG: RagB/SusD family nutrient uptake outer membrane protein [Flavobacteriaceae bacterium]
MKKIFLILTIAAFITSCNEDYLDASLANTVTDDDIAKLAEESPEALLTVASSFDAGTVNNLRTFGVSGSTGHYDYGQKSIDMVMDLMSNDMINDGNGWWYDDYYKFIGRGLDRTETVIIWNFYYEIIKGANQTISLIGGLEEAQLTDDLNYVLARSKVIRGFAYLQLIQIYQKGQPALSDAGIPIVDPTADLINGPGFGRLTVGEVYTQIEKDFTEGYDALDGYSRDDKTSINQDITAGFLARYYLLIGENDKAVTFAQQAQNAGSLVGGQTILDGFQSIANPEWIWGADLDEDKSSYYASFFAHIQAYSPVFFANNGYTPGYTGQLGHHKTVDKRLYSAISDTDTRKQWFGPDNGFIFGGSEDQIYNYKFYDDTFFEADYVYMRVAEMYLIEAEAKANLGDAGGAAQALYNLVSTRDAEYSKSSATGTALMEEIRLHRRIELWGEGFGLLDMKRWNVGLTRVYEGSNHPNVTASYFDLIAGDKSFTFQIPEDEINTNDAISSGDQNP